MTDLADLLAAPYRLEIVWSDADPPDTPGWVANLYEFAGCQAQGDTPEELEENLRRAMEAWIDAEMEEGRPIPEPGDEPEYRATLVGIAPLVIVENMPGFATHYRELLTALAASARVEMREKVTA